MASIGMSVSGYALAEFEISQMDLSGTDLLAIDQPAVNASLAVEVQVLDLFTEMRAPIFRHLLWLHLHADQAEDVVQETFLRLHQHQFRPDFKRQNLRGWVWRVAHNLGVNVRLATNRKENGRELELGEVSAWLVDPGSNPEETLEQRQREERIAAAIEILNDRDQQCMELRAQGLGYRQIAARMGIGRSTVADTLERVTNHLRSQSSL